MRKSQKWLPETAQQPYNIQARNAGSFPFTPSTFRCLIAINKWYALYRFLHSHNVNLLLYAYYTIILRLQDEQSL